MSSGAIRFLVLILSWPCIILCGCANQVNKKFEHGFNVNFGSGPNISSVVIHYGDFSRDFCGGSHGCRPGYGVFYGVHMPIQSELQVIWRLEDGSQYQTKVAVRNGVKDLQRLASIELRFQGGQLRIMQWLHSYNPSILEFEKFPLVMNK